MTENPRNLALAFLEKYEPKGRQEPKERQKAGDGPASSDSGNVSQALVRPVPQEIISPQANPIALPMPNIPAMKPIDVAPLEASLKEMFELLDLNEPEGMFDTIFSRPDHRIEKKTERALRLAQYRAALTTIIAESRRAIEEVSALNNARSRQYLDMLMLAADVLEAQARLNYAVAAAARQDAVAEAKAKFEIAGYVADAEKARLSALPPAPPPPAPTPVDEATRKREEARRSRREEIDQHLEEQEERAAASEESVARVKTRCIETYRNLTMRDGEKRARIMRVLDEYNLDCSILPVAIEDLITRGYEEVEE
ncbi:MAG: hypothetical protein ACHQIK_09890 [Candidatus Acidiferrales bacterium]